MQGADCRNWKYSENAQKYLFSRLDSLCRAKLPSVSYLSLTLSLKVLIKSGGPFCFAANGIQRTSPPEQEAPSSRKVFDMKEMELFREDRVSSHFEHVHMNSGGLRQLCGISGRGGNGDIKEIFQECHMPE